MSYFGKNIKVEKKIVVTYLGKVYFTASGLTGSLADNYADQLLEYLSNKEWQETSNSKKYGTPRYSDPKGLAKWKAHKKRLRTKFIRRALPIIKKLFSEN